LRARQSLHQTVSRCSGETGAFSALQPGRFVLAKLSAASFLAIVPIMMMGWFTQKQLVRGLTFGAVK
jgi:sorbitol/mannitol transport system permease protein